MIIGRGAESEVFWAGFVAESSAVEGVDSKACCEASDGVQKADGAVSDMGSGAEESSTVPAAPKLRRVMCQAFDVQCARWAWR